MSDAGHCHGLTVPLRLTDDPYMDIKRAKKLILLWATVLVAALITYPATPASAASAIPSTLCAQPNKAIPASLLAKGAASTSSCKLVGRQVSSEFGTVQVPKEGHTAGGASITKAPALGSELVVTNRGGTVTARTVSPSSQKPKLPSIAACDDDAYSLHTGDWTTFFWYYNYDTTPSWLNRDNVVKNIRYGNTRATTDWSDCTFNGSPAAYGSFQGDTNYHSQMSASSDGTINCKSDVTPNVVEWQDIPQRPDGHITLAATCWWYNNVGDMTGADAIYGIHGNQDLRTKLPDNCTTEEDIQSVAAHEFGHAFGLNHVTGGEHYNLTMYPNIPQCWYAKRSFGKGDWLGMVTKYGYR